MTRAWRLPNRHVIHCLGPVYGQDEPAAELLASCYRKALRLAEKEGLSSIAFPAISTGAFGYPFLAGAEVACDTIFDELPGLVSLRIIRFVLIDEFHANLVCTLLAQRASGNANSQGGR